MWYALAGILLVSIIAIWAVRARRAVRAADAKRHASRVAQTKKYSRSLLSPEEAERQKPRSGPRPFGRR
jgi:hypothetical protein